MSGIQNPWGGGAESSLRREEERIYLETENLAIVAGEVEWPTP